METDENFYYSPCRRAIWTINVYRQCQYAQDRLGRRRWIHTHVYCTNTEPIIGQV